MDNTISGNLAPIAEFDKTPPSPPPEDVPMDDLPPPPHSGPVATPATPASITKSPSTLKEIIDAYYPEDTPRGDEKRWTVCNWCEYLFITITTCILLIAAGALTLIWLFKFRDGVSIDLATATPKSQYLNFHIIAMVSAFIILAGLSFISFRVLRCCNKIAVSLIHVVLTGGVVPIAFFGILAAFEYHEDTNQTAPHFASLHSWLGLLTCGLFALQIVLGLISFVICGFITACEKYRNAFTPIHATLGVTNFMIAVATVCTGLTQREITESREDSWDWTDEGIIINAAGVVFVALGIVISYSVRRPPARSKAKVFVTEKL